MYKTIIKKIASMCLLTTFLTITPSEKLCHSTRVSSYPIEWCIVGSAVALIIGKLAYNYYHNNQISAQDVIKNCQAMYNNIHHDVQTYHKFYHSDAHISDWELKAAILDNNAMPYPFKRYYIALTKAVSIMHNHRITLSKQLAKIDIYQQQLIQLKTKGKHLLQQISETISLLSILTIRLKLFKEYKDDCYYWSQKKQNTHTGNP